MALSVKTKHSKKKLDGYLHINNIAFIRGGSGFGSSTREKGKFTIQITYSIFEKEKSGKIISRGIHNLVWDENQKTSNVFSYAYNELKKLEIFKVLKDI